jgi:nitrate/TMAO reductase-like tetraheme cytochrome c subunit
MFGAGALAGIVLLVGGYEAVHLTGTPEFCMICHEMRVVGEQGWMRSAHYRNDAGVVAKCADCHIPPEPVAMLWVKMRDGTKDIAAHLFGESDPMKMDWEHLRKVAREKISDSSCMRCHENLTPYGAPLTMQLAHRRYQRMDEHIGCLDCHRRELHGEFRYKYIDTDDKNNSN